MFVSSSREWTYVLSVIIQPPFVPLETFEKHVTQIEYKNVLEISLLDLLQETENGPDAMTYILIIVSSRKRFRSRFQFWTFE